jgi:hypothetical protein
VGALGLRHWRTRTQSGACDNQTVPKQRFGRSYEASSPTRTPHAIVFASHPLTMRANTTQKAYDEAFLACSTAVYFEGQVRVLSHAQLAIFNKLTRLLQKNEKEALRSWKTALDHIYYHNARRNPTTYRPTSETDKALVESLRQLELQCKERVDLLEVLKKSREESKESLASAPDGQAPTPPPHGVPVAQAETGTSSDWLGGGTIRPVDYSDLSRPPPLPTRPSMTPRQSSGNTAKRINSLTQNLNASTLSVGASEE